ncbi:hypothetical protein [Aneurinibacillus sp. REN35]|uniref:hypothetical protein n=2 Tax=Paenibacillaceae TaxID=186822 RepID=UPI003529A35E
MKKTRKALFWISTIMLVSVLQVGVLQQVDEFLAPPSLEMKQAAAAEKTERTLAPPEEVVQSAMTSDAQRLAYVMQDNAHTIMIQDKNGTVDSVEEEGNITYMKWLGKSNTLLYMVEKRKGQEMRLLQMAHDEPVVVYEWSSKKEKVEDVFFSPYLEFFYVHMKDENRDELYKYTASQGLQKLQIGAVRIASIDYDEKNDILYISNTKGRLWEFKDGAMHRSSLKVQEFS